MIDQTGLDPSPALRELETAILTEEFFGFPATTRPPITAPASAFVGRDDEVLTVSDLLDESRIVSLVGQGE